MLKFFQMSVKKSAPGVAGGKEAPRLLLFSGDCVSRGITDMILMG